MSTFHITYHCLLEHLKSLYYDKLSVIFLMLNFRYIQTFYVNLVVINKHFKYNDVSVVFYGL